MTPTPQCHLVTYFDNSEQLVEATDHADARAKGEELSNYDGYIGMSSSVRSPENLNDGTSRNWPWSAAA